MLLRPVMFSVALALVWAAAGPQGLTAQAKPAPPKPAAAGPARTPAQPREAGMYVDSAGKLEQLEPSVYSGGKTSGVLKSAATYGIAKAKWKAVVRGSKANQRVASTPTFYFLFESKSSGLSYTGAGGSAMLMGATSPNEFVLAKFDAQKSSRELTVGESGSLGANTGVRPEDMVDFRSQKISTGYYKVTPNAPLAPGEYCFFSPGAFAAAGASATGKLFDFGVDGR